MSDNNIDGDGDGASPVTHPTIAIDFDGTMVEHAYPSIGKAVPGAVDSIKEFIRLGARIFLYTMRSGQQLGEACDWCEEQGIKLSGANTNPSQRKWTASPKCYAELYIDDAAVGCPLIFPGRAHDPYADWPLGLEGRGTRPYVNWDKVRPIVIRYIRTGSRRE